MNDAEVEKAYDIAKAESRRGTIIVESFVTGRDYRCLIVGGKMQAIAERVPAHVIGDGTQHGLRARRHHRTPTRVAASGTRRS